MVEGGCQFCQMDTAGSHEDGCPARPRTPGLQMGSIREVTGPMGWVCPTCGAGISPFAQACPHCAPPMRVTCSTTWGVDISDVPHWLKARTWA